MRPISVRRLLLVLLLTAAALVAFAPHAVACSCLPLDLGRQLHKADGAFVGTLLSRDDPEPVDGLLSSATLVRYHYLVERAVKGDIPSGTIDVWSAWIGVSCGLETPVGQRAGLLLRRHEGRWASSLCEQADTDALEQAAPARPASASEGGPAPPSPDGDGTGRRPLLAGGAGASLLAAGIAGLVRRRWAPKL